MASQGATGASGAHNTSGRRRARRPAASGPAATAHEQTPGGWAGRGGGGQPAPRRSLAPGRPCEAPGGGGTSQARAGGGECVGGPAAPRHRQKPQGLGRRGSACQTCSEPPWRQCQGARVSGQTQSGATQRGSGPSTFGAFAAPGRAGGAAVHVRPVCCEVSNSGQASLRRAGGVWGARLEQDTRVAAGCESGEGPVARPHCALRPASWREVHAGCNVHDVQRPRQLARGLPPACGVWGGGEGSGRGRAGGAYTARQPDERGGRLGVAEGGSVPRAADPRQRVGSGRWPETPAYRPSRASGREGRPGDDGRVAGSIPSAGVSGGTINGRGEGSGGPRAGRVPPDGRARRTGAPDLGAFFASGREARAGRRPEPGGRLWRGWSRSLVGGAPEHVYMAAIGVRVLALGQVGRCRCEAWSGWERGRRTPFRLAVCLLFVWC